MAQPLLPGFGVLDGPGGSAVIPGAGALDSEAVPVNIAVPAGALSLTGHAPTVAVTADVYIFAPRGVLAFTGYAPAVTVSPTPITHIVVPHGTMTLHGRAPFVRVREAGAAVTPASTKRRPGLLLTDQLPLQLSAQIGAYSEALVLPQRYGDLRRSRFKLIRMTSTKYIAAGHAMKSITRAFTANLQTSSFEAYVESAGDVIYHVVEFAAPVPVGTECSASGEGKMHATTGALIENPADIMADIMLLAGRDDPWFGQLRGEASEAGITLAGSIAKATTIRDALDVVADSCGAIWCPGMARLYPAPFDTETGFRLPLNRAKAPDLHASADVTDTADIARIAYGYDEALDDSKAFIQLEASPQRFNGKQVDIVLPWARSAAVVESVGRRLLPWFAGVRINATFTTPLTEFVRPGTWTLLQNNPNWPEDDEPTAMIMSAVLNRSKREAAVTVEAVTSVPIITMTKHSLGDDGLGSGGIEVLFKNGIATFIITDDADKPIVGAYVALDGGAPKKTNAQGQVTFVTTEGPHQIEISAEGKVDIDMEIDL